MVSRINPACFPSSSIRFCRHALSEMIMNFLSLEDGQGLSAQDAVRRGTATKLVARDAVISRRPSPPQREGKAGFCPGVVAYCGVAEKLC